MDPVTAISLIRGIVFTIEQIYTIRQRILSNYVELLDLSDRILSLKFPLERLIVAISSNSFSEQISQDSLIRLSRLLGECKTFINYHLESTYIRCCTHMFCNSSYQKQIEKFHLRIDRILPTILMGLIFDTSNASRNHLDLIIAKEKANRFKIQEDIAEDSKSDRSVTSHHEPDPTDNYNYSSNHIFSSSPNDNSLRSPLLPNEQITSPSVASCLNPILTPSSTFSTSTSIPPAISSPQSPLRKFQNLPHSIIPHSISSLLADKKIPKQDRDPLICKAILVGDSEVGKTALVYRYVDDFFSSTYCSTIGVDYRFHNLCIDGQYIRLQLWDTAGQERFRSISRSFFRGSHVALLIFSLDNRKSLEALQGVIDDVRTHAWLEPDQFVLIGNKFDLKGNTSSSSSSTSYSSETATCSRKTVTDSFVSLDELHSFMKINAIQYFFETSARDGTNVQQLFNAVAGIFWLKYKSSPEYHQPWSPQTLDDSVRVKILGRNEKRKKCC